MDTWQFHKGCSAKLHWPCHLPRSSSSGHSAMPAIPSSKTVPDPSPLAQPRRSTRIQSKQEEKTKSKKGLKSVLQSASRLLKTKQAVAASTSAATESVGRGSVDATDFLPTLKRRRTLRTKDLRLLIHPQHRSIGCPSLRRPSLFACLLPRPSAQLLPARPLPSLQFHKFLK